MIALRILVVLAWVVAQLIGLLVGGFALLGTQYGESGTTALGVVLLVAPALIAGGALFLSWRLADPGAARLVLIAALVLLAGGFAALYLSIIAARGG